MSTSSSSIPTPVDADDVVESHTTGWSEEKQAKYSEYIASQQLTAEPIISDGLKIIYDYGRGPTFTTIRPTVDLRVRNGKAKASALIGHPYYSTFMVSGKNPTLSRRPEGKVKVTSIFSHLSERDDPSFLPTATNEELYDRGIQTISNEEIAQMKAEGKSGDDIIRAIAAASKTFDSKTEFSQEKWLRKKHAKYNTDITILRPTPQSVLRAALEKNARRVMYLRDDTLAQILQMANVGVDSRTLVVETTSGLIAGSVAYRQGENAKVLNAFIGQSPTLTLVDDLNLSQAARASISSFPLSEIFTVAPVNPTLALEGMGLPEPFINQNTRVSDQGRIIPLNDANTMASMTTTNLTTTITSTAVDANTDSMTDTDALTSPRISDDGDDKSDVQNETEGKAVMTEKDVPLYRRYSNIGLQTLAQGATSLILCTTYSPSELLLPLLPYLLPSSPFVVYCPNPEPLTRLQTLLSSQRRATDVHVQEYWTREIQVLPNRTHPMMSTSGTGGYILSGVTIIR